MYIPQSIQKIVGDAPYEADSIGMSGSAVLCYENMVLKIEPESEGFAGQLAMLRWLDGKLPVPKVLQAVTEDGKQYLLMSRVPGKMSCSPEYMADPDWFVGQMAEALQMLWQVDISTCPKHRTLQNDLLEAEERVSQGLVQTDLVEPETFGDGGFPNPEALLAWLQENQPESEPVLSHGDFCLPNVFLEQGQVSGFIDLGDCGISDKWRDIALLHRSLRHNFNGRYASIPRPDFDPDLLFEKLGIQPNWEKLRYYQLLDELF